LIESPPRFGSKRFREILWPALRGNPLLAASGLWWLICRRRVRGWSRLLIAASEAPYDYARWIGNGERRAFARFRDTHPVRHAVRVIPVILGGQHTNVDAVQATLKGLRVAFGDQQPIYSTSEQPDLCEPTPLQARMSPEIFHTEFAREFEGDWLFPVLAGDSVSPLILDAVQRICNDCDDARLVYWDEDQIGSNGREAPWIKPDWDEVLFAKLGGLAGSSVLRIGAAQSLAAALIGSPDKQDLERALFAIGTAENSPEPVHIPLVLTHRHPSNSLHAEELALPDDFSKTSWPSVSVIIPTRDRADLLAACIKGLKETSYSGALQLIVVDNGSVDPAALRILETLNDDPQARVISDSAPFNFSELNNAAARIAAGDYLCFLNNDVEPIDGDWLKRMVARAMGEQTGAVGAMLLYPGGRIQHAGVAVGVGGAAGHLQKGVMPQEQRFWTWHRVTREVSAVTAAVMVIRKRKFFEVGGFDAESFPVAFNDVDLCLRLKEAGYRNLYVAEARLIHRESESRGDDRNRRNVERYSRELSALQERWKTTNIVDRHFSPLFSRSVERCVLMP
jgi:GT2 family glycosyltransferase